MSIRRVLIGVMTVAAATSLAITTTASASSAKAAGDNDIVGAGSSFAAPLFTAWYQYYNPKAGVNVSYNSIGSGGGISQITARTVDFGASDAPLTPSQMDACKGCIQIPVLLGTTAVLYNIPGVTKQVNLTGSIIADIYLGKISKWNDPAITAINASANLPDLRITPAYRSDGSGTSYNFSDYLTTVSPEWASKVGKSTQPAYPAGVGARGSSGVAGVVTSTPGAIGYADVAYALKNHLRFAAIKNKAGAYATPGIRAGAAAASLVTTIPADNAISLVDPPATAKTRIAYPISTFTWVIVPQSSSKAKLIKRFLLFAISDQGQALGKPLLYPAMPKVVQIAAARSIAKITQS